MKAISTFFTIFWIIYFPTCIAFDTLPGFSSVDEVMTVILMTYTLMQSGNRATNKRPWQEYFTFLGILAFYIVYSLIRRVNVPESVWLDLVQQIRPYSVLYCTWILNPRFSKSQQKWMLAAMLATLAAYLIIQPQGYANGQLSRSAQLGQLAITTAMTWYLFTEPTRRNFIIILAILATPIVAIKYKYIGEAVAFIALLLFLKKPINLLSSKAMAYAAVLGVVVTIATWERVDAYYGSGWDNKELARPMNYKTALLILRDYFPFGPGMGTFATLGAWLHYSPLYPKYGLDKIWGLDAGGGFITDAFYPSLAQFGVVGVGLFIAFWKRRLADLSRIADLRYFRVGLMAFLCLAIESTADSSYLSGKGMGFFMLLGLALNHMSPASSIRKS